jgi:hypothetical protein
MKRQAGIVEQTAPNLLVLLPFVTELAPLSGRPLVLFAARFVIIKPLGNIRGKGRIRGVCDGSAVLLLIFFPSRSGDVFQRKLTEAEH